MKVFISHQKEDAFKARQISVRLLKEFGIDSYLDVVDPLIGMRFGPDLADHVREEMEDCDSLLAVVSANTATSQWVPWEIGIATEKGFRLATFASSNYKLPEFLQKWPYLTNDQELTEYANLLLEMGPRTHLVMERMGTYGSVESISQSSHDEAREFHRRLQRALGR